MPWRWSDDPHPLPRPLDPVRSIKIKIGMILIGAGAAGMAWFTIWLHWFPIWTSVDRDLVGADHAAVPGARHDLAAARDDRGGQGDGAGRLHPDGCGPPPRDEVGQLARRSTRWLPTCRRPIGSGGS
jgi:hypothetical protein